MDRKKLAYLTVGLMVCLVSAAIILYLTSGKGERKRIFKRPELARVDQFIESGEYSKTIPMLRKLREALPDEAEIFYASAWVNYKLYRFRPAMKMAEQALQKEPGAPAAQAILGAAHYHLSNFDKALDASRKAMRSDPKLALPYHIIGAVYLRMGNTDEGIKLLKESIRLEPDNGMFWSKMSSAYLKRKDLTKSLEASKKALKLDPALAGAHFNMGMAFFHSGDADAAVKHLQKAEYLFIEKRDKGWIARARHTRNLIVSKRQIKTQK